MNWLTYPFYKVPVPKLVIVPTGPWVTVMADADYDMAQAISQDIRGYVKFLAATPDPQYKDPTSYATGLIAYAQSLTQSSYAKYIVPDGWNPVQAAISYTNIVFQTLQQIPVNASDPATVSVFDAWIAGTGQLLGGHGPIPAPQQVGSGGQQPVPPGASISIL